MSRGVFQTVFKVGPEAIRLGVPAAFLGTPFLVGEDGSARVRLNEYFMARRNGDWSHDQQNQGSRSLLEGNVPVRTALKSLNSNIYHIEVARRWCRDNGMALLSMDAAAVERYASFLGSPDGAGLRPASLNRYLGSVIDLQRYAAARGWRAALTLRTREVRGRRGMVSRPTVYRAEPDTEDRRYYTQTQIERFIEEFPTAGGKLAAKIMYRTGSRLAETLNLEPSDFPTIDEYRRAPDARYLRIRAGKGGKDRRIELDLELLEEVRRYESFDRKLLVKGYRSGCDRLIVTRLPGGRIKPMAARRLQKDCAMSSAAAGLGHVHPHMLRHHYAAHYLIRAWSRRATTRGLDWHVFAVEPHKSLLDSDLLQLQRNLGHASLDTTNMYLHAISPLLGSSMAGDYSTALDGDLEW